MTNVCDENDRQTRGFSKGAETNQKTHFAIGLFFARKTEESFDNSTIHSRTFFLAKREEEREDTRFCCISLVCRHRLRQSQRGRVLLRVGEREKERRKERTWAKMTSSGGEK